MGMIRRASAVAIVLLVACGEEEGAPAEVPADAAPPDAAGAGADAGADAGIDGPLDTGTPDAGPPRVAFREIAPMFEERCGLCHHVGGMGQTPILRGEGVRDGLVGVDSVAVPGMALVAPGDPDGSWLLHKIAGTHLAVCAERDIPDDRCGGRMPRGTSEVLSEGDVDRVRIWIADGAQ